MKALTIRQPWASLIALGVKTIETRTWSTNYRGPLLIHAGKALPVDVRPYRINRDTMWNYARPHDDPIPLPLGAVVAVANLVDCVPIGVDILDVWGGPVIAPNQAGVLWLIPGGYSEVVDLTDQRPYGDYTPGRYGWLLDNIRPLEHPIPARGKQGLWIPDLAVVVAAETALAVN